AVVAQGLAVEIPGRPAAHAGGAALHALQRRGDARLELGVEVFVEEVRRLHDVHVAIDEPVAVLHRTLLPRTNCRNGALAKGCTQGAARLPEGRVSITSERRPLAGRPAGRRRSK